MTPQPEARAMTFEQWFYAKFESNPEYQKSIKHHPKEGAQTKICMEGSWHARDAEVTALEEENAKLREALRRIAEARSNIENFRLSVLALEALEVKR